MQVSIRTLAVVGTMLAGALFIMSNRIDDLKQDVKTATEVAEANGKAIIQLQQDFKGLQAIDKDRSERRQAQQKSDAKLEKDSKRSDVVAKKPELVEKQINRSFDKFAQDLQEATR